MIFENLTLHHATAEGQSAGASTGAVVWGVLGAYWGVNEVFAGMMEWLTGQPYRPDSYKLIDIATGDPVTTDNLIFLGELGHGTLSRPPKPRSVIGFADDLGEAAARRASNAAIRGQALIQGPLTRKASNALRDAARDIWQDRMGWRAIWKNLDVHHRIPLEWSHLFPYADPNRAANLVGIATKKHGLVNAEWSAFKAALNGRMPTAAEVMQKAIEIDNQFGDLFTFLK
jgi:hypothetical protein